MTLYFIRSGIKYIFFAWNGRYNILCTRNWLNSEHMVYNIGGKIYFYPVVLWTGLKKYIAIPGPLTWLMSPVCGWCKLTSDLDPTPVRDILIGPHVCKWVQIYIFSLSYNLTSDDLWPWYMTFDHMNIWRFPYYINKPSLVPIQL